MSKAQRDVVLLAAGRIGAAALSFVWLLIVARELGPETFGRLMTLLSLGALLSAVHDAGHQFALTESVARDRARLVPSVRFVIRRRLVLGLAAATVVAAAYSATFRWELSAPAIFGVSILATAVYSTVTAGLRGAEVIVPDAANELLSRMVIVAIGLPLLLGGGGLLGVVVAYGATDLLSAAVLLVVFRRITIRNEYRSGSVDSASFAWRNLIPLGATVAVATISYRIDIWMVAAIRGSEDAGIYGAAYRLQDGVFIPAAALVTARVASILGAPSSDLLRRVRRLGSVSVAIALVPAVVVAVASPLVLEATFGNDYSASVGVLRLLLVSTPISAAVIVLMPALASRARTSSLRLVTVGALVNVVLNAVLVPRWGPSGAATATVITQATVAAVGLVLLRRVVRTTAHPRSQNVAESPQ